jgi:hypothetical protein
LYAWAADFVAPRAGVAIAVPIALGVTALASCALDLAVSRPAARLGRIISNNLLLGAPSGQAAWNWTERPLILGLLDHNGDLCRFLELHRHNTPLAGHHCDSPFPGLTSKALTALSCSQLFSNFPISPGRKINSLR